MRDKKVLLLFLGGCFLFLAGCDGAKDREAKYLGRAQVYFDEANYEKMQVELKNVLQINPKNIEARYLTALAAEKNQNWRKMFGNLSAVVEAKPDHFEAQLKLGKLFLFSKDTVKASEKVEIVLAKQPDNPDALALKATIHLSKNEKAQAKSLLKKVLEIEPGHYEASLLMMNILGKENKLSEAKSILEKALAAHPDKLRLALLKIKTLLDDDKKNEAKTLYNSVIQRFPDNENLYYNLAKLYVAEKKNDSAEEVLNKLVKQLPDKDQPKLVLVDFLNRQYGVERAVKKLDQLISESPENFGFRFAKLALFKDQPEKIQQILEAIIEDDKLGASGIDARIKLANFINSKGDGDRARKLIEEVIELDSRNSQALLFRAGFLLNDMDFDGAIADVRSVLRDEPQNEKALMLQSIAQLQANKYELAQETLEKVLLVNPKNLLAIKDLARVKVRLKDEKGAIEILEKSRGMFQDDRDIAVMLIDLYGNNKEWSKAEQIAKQLLQKSETKELPHYKLAQLYLGQKKFEDAIGEFNKILAIKPAEPDVLAGLVNSYLALKQQGKADKLLDDVLADDKDNPVLLTMRAELYRQNKQFTDAERLFERVVELKPKIELGYENLASVYVAQKQLDKLINVFQQGLKAIPESTNFLMRLGGLNTVAGDKEKAIEAYEKLLLIESDNVFAANNMAALLVENSDKQRLQQAYALVAPLKNSEYSAILDTYGWVSYKNGKVDDALIALESVMKKEGIIPEMHYHLGMVYIEKGRIEEAKLELEKAIVENAQYNGLDKAKAELKKLKAL